MPLPKNLMFIYKMPQPENQRLQMTLRVAVVWDVMAGFIYYIYRILYIHVYIIIVFYFAGFEVRLEVIIIFHTKQLRKDVVQLRLLTFSIFGYVCSVSSLSLFFPTSCLISQIKADVLECAKQQGLTPKTWEIAVEFLARFWQWCTRLAWFS